MRTVPHTIAPLPLHADLIYTSDVAPTPEEVPASSAAGTVQCAACKMEVVVRELRQRVGGHIRETKVRTFCLLHTSMYPRKPTRRFLLGKAYRTALKTLAMKSLLNSC